MKSRTSCLRLVIEYLKTPTGYLKKLVATHIKQCCLTSFVFALGRYGANPCYGYQHGWGLGLDYPFGIAVRLPALSRLPIPMRVSTGSLNENTYVRNCLNKNISTPRGLQFEKEGGCFLIWDIRLCGLERNSAGGCLCVQRGAGVRWVTHVGRCRCHSHAVYTGAHNRTPRTH